MVKSMKKMANVRFNNTGNQEIVRVIAHATEDGYFLYLFDSFEDVPCLYDDWFDSLAKLEEACEEYYGITSSDWKDISDR